MVPEALSRDSQQLLSKSLQVLGVECVKEYIELESIINL